MTPPGLRAAWVESADRDREVLLRRCVWSRLPVPSERGIVDVCPCSSVDRAAASGAVCAGSSPVRGTLH